MTLPRLPVFPSDDTSLQQSERYRQYLTLLRGDLEGQEAGISNTVEQGQLWGFFPPPAGTLLVDPSFELNRTSWLTPPGTYIQESVGFALSGNYVLNLDAARGYSAGFVVANTGVLTPCIPGQLFVCGGHALGSVSSPGTAHAYINFYNASRTTIVSTIAGPGVALQNFWQLFYAKGVVPANAVYAQFVYQVIGLTGSETAAFDDMFALVAHQQVEPAESAAQVNFASTTETVLASATFGPTVQIPVGWVISLQTPVIILANCVYGAGVGAGGNITFRIRRTNAAGTVLATMPNLVAVNGSLCIMAFDTTPNVTAQTWVLTGQMANATGGNTAEHRIVASQHYL